MPETLHRTYHDEEIVNVETHHEESDVNVRALLWFVVIFVAFAAVTHLALLLMFKFFVQIERGNANAPLTAMAHPERRVPETPRLQPFPTRTAADREIPPYASTPVVDMEEMRAHEDEVLNNYGWVDKDHGIVHIPIEQAKKMALQSGIYKQATTPQQPGNPATQQPVPPATQQPVPPPPHP